MVAAIVRRCARQRNLAGGPGRRPGPGRVGECGDTSGARVSVVRFEAATQAPTSRGVDEPCQRIPGLDVAKMSQAAMNIAAITGPMTKPLTPSTAMPPSVEISTR
jgi:hypothetical protein